MNNEHHTLIAFLAVLVAIVILVGMGVAAAQRGQSLEALGIGAAVTGLIGVLGTFRPRQNNITPASTPNDPVTVTEHIT